MEPEQAPGNGAGGAQPQGDAGKPKRSAISTALAIGAVLLEPELLPGIAIGVAAMAIPKYFPEAVARLRPLGDAVRRAAGETAARGRTLGQKALDLGQKALALGKKLGNEAKDKAMDKAKQAMDKAKQAKEKIAHVTGRTVPSESGQPA